MTPYSWHVAGAHDLGWHDDNANNGNSVCRNGSWFHASALHVLQPSSVRDSVCTILDTSLARDFDALHSTTTRRDGPSVEDQCGRLQDFVDYHNIDTDRSYVAMPAVAYASTSLDTHDVCLDLCTARLQETVAFIRERTFENIGAHESRCLSQRRAPRAPFERTRHVLTPRACPRFAGRHTSWRSSIAALPRRPACYFFLRTLR